MSVGVNKSGVVNAGSFVETNGAMLNTFMSEGYTPTASVENSCMGRYITGFVKGKSYVIDMTVIWSGFKTDVADNFNIGSQGSCYDGTSWSWNYSNPMCNAINNLKGFKDLVLSADSGSKRYVATFSITSDCTGLELGCRTNYSNGKGTITYSNIRVVPADNYVDGSTSAGKLTDDSIVMDNFIEM
jgi:hypothetical protein